MNNVILKTGYFDTEKNQLVQTVEGILIPHNTLNETVWLHRLEHRILTIQTTVDVTNGPRRGEITTTITRTVRVQKA